MSTFRSALSLLFIAQTVLARSYNPCELQNQLVNVHNLTADVSRNLTCVAQKFSSLTTNIIVGDYYGLFQIKKSYCGENESGGKCNIKCQSLLDDDISDDIVCAEKAMNHLLKRLKFSGCHEQFKYLDENCHKENPTVDDKYQVKQDFCESAMELMTLYDISEIDALTWACIKEFSKTGIQKISSNGDVCVRTHDIECAIKNQTGFNLWPAYDRYCKNISSSVCFGDHKGVESVDGIKTGTEKPKIFTTSTDVSLIIEDENGHQVHYSGADVTTETSRESQQTTEFLSNTLEIPTEKTTIEGYSKVRFMHLDKEIETTTEELKESVISSQSFSKSVSSTESSSIASDPPIISTTDEIEFKYFQTIDKCSLANDMKNFGSIPENLISTFVCIAEHESGMNLSFTVTDGLQSRYGLFQIDNQVYCSTNTMINQCDVLCAHLIDDQFDNDFECVRHIYKKEGLSYWPSFEKSCKNIESSSLDYCYKEFTTSHRPFTVVSKEIETIKISTENVESTEATTMSYAVTDNSPAFGHDFCDFSYQLFVNGSSLDNLPYYMCIIDKTSQLRQNSSTDNEAGYGIFGLNPESCGLNEAGGFCSIFCSSFLDDNLLDDTKCAAKILKDHGLEKWNLSKDDCRIYKTKILECIDEDKFSLPTDDEVQLHSEASLSVTQMPNELNASQLKFEVETLGPNDHPEESKTSTTTPIEIESFTTVLLMEEPEPTRENNFEAILQDEMLIEVKTLKDVHDKISYDSTTQNPDSVDMTSQSAIILSQDESFKDLQSDENTTEIPSEPSNEIEMLIKRIIDDEVVKLATLPPAETPTEPEREEEVFSVTMPSSSLDETTTDENEVANLMEYLNEEVTTTSAPHTTAQAILLRIPAIRFSYNTHNSLNDINGPQALALMADENEPLKMTEPLDENSINDDFTEPSTENNFYSSISEIIDEFEKRNSSSKLNSRKKRALSGKVHESVMNETMQESQRIFNEFYTDVCTLTRYLQESGYPYELIPTFICIAENESRFNIETVLADGPRKKFGLFQIDDQVYCSTNEEIHACNVSCGHLVDDHLEDDIDCVRIVYEREGFEYWPSYEGSCRNVNPNSLDYCYQEFVTSQKPFSAGRRGNRRNENYYSSITERSKDLAENGTDSSSVVKTFELCELARELYSLNQTIDDIPIYLCIADIKSQLKIRRPNSTDKYYGLFHIDSEYCGKDSPGGICSIKCEQLWDDNLMDDIECVEKIDDTQNFGLYYNLTSANCNPYSRKVLLCNDKNRFETTKRTKNFKPQEINTISNHIDMRRVAKEYDNILDTTTNSAESTESLRDLASTNSPKKHNLPILLQILQPPPILSQTLEANVESSPIEIVTETYETVTEPREMATESLLETTSELIFDTTEPSSPVNENTQNFLTTTQSIISSHLDDELISGTTSQESHETTTESHPKSLTQSTVDATIPATFDISTESFTTTQSTTFSPSIGKFHYVTREPNFSQQVDNFFSRFTKLRIYNESQSTQELASTPFIIRTIDIDEDQDQTTPVVEPLLTENVQFDKTESVNVDVLQTLLPPKPVDDKTLEATTEYQSVTVAPIGSSITEIDQSEKIETTVAPIGSSITENDQSEKIETIRLDLLQTLLPPELPLDDKTEEPITKPKTTNNTTEFSESLLASEPFEGTTEYTTLSVLPQNTEENALNFSDTTTLVTTAVIETHLNDTTEATVTEQIEIQKNEETTEYVPQTLVSETTSEDYPATVASEILGASGEFNSKDKLGTSEVLSSVHEINVDTNIPFQIESIIKSITNHEPKNGSTIFNIFNINIYPEKTSSTVDSDVDDR